MGFAGFVSDVYGDVLLRHSGTLADLRKITVRQLAELSPRRTLFMQDSAAFTLPVRDPYLGEWAGPGLDGFPLDIMEIDCAYYAAPTGRLEIEGPVPIGEIRTYLPATAATQNPATLVYPEKWAWWGGRFWVTKVGGDIAIELDVFRDATRDRTTGAKIQENSDKETNGWLERGALALRYAVLAEYYLLPKSANAEAAQNAAGQRNLFLETIGREERLRTGSALQAPMCL